MAITLPYPDLVFVPLDKLTAEEMNEIVANYTYIANEAGKSTFVEHTGTSHAITGTAQTAFDSMDITQIPNGAKFLAMARISCYGTGANVYFDVSMRYNNQQTGIETVTSTATRSIVMFGGFTKTSGANAIELTGSVISGSATAGSNYIAAWVVG